MKISPEKQSRLTHVAHRYYIEDWKQGDIAKELGISRPLVSRMLSEAKEYGIVEIIIHEPEEEAEQLLKKLKLSSTIRGGVLVEDGEDDASTNDALSQGAVNLLHQVEAHRLGLGWGHLIGQLVTWLEENPQEDSTISDVCPLVGNARLPARNYQSDENVRLVAQQLSATPHFLFLPALPENIEEKKVLCSTEIYRQILQEWEQLDTVLVNIGNYPSSPDFASLVRYGNLLQEQHACGRMLAYYFNDRGKMILSDEDFAIQIPLEVLKKCHNIIGVCSAHTSPQALLGAVRSGILTHIVARMNIIQPILY
ncbi:MAG: transcriptional regulator [Lachnospiraceae bacterium]|nr:transcriptional regulator [Lachnospiraceae bacterium]